MLPPPVEPGPTLAFIRRSASTPTSAQPRPVPLRAAAAAPYAERQPRTSHTLPGCASMAATVRVPLAPSRPQPAGSRPGTGLDSWLDLDGSGPPRSRPPRWQPPIREIPRLHPRDTAAAKKVHHPPLGSARCRCFTSPIAGPQRLPLPCRPLRSLDPAAAAPKGPGAQHGPTGNVVHTVHQVGALSVAAVILVFGVLGFAGGLAFFSTSGEPILGMSTNGLLSTISVITATVLIVAALPRPPTRFHGDAHHRNAVPPVSAGQPGAASDRFQRPCLPDEQRRLLRRRRPRPASHRRLRPADRQPAGRQPLRTERAAPEPPEVFPSTPAEFAAEQAMRDAELAVVNHVATPDQLRRVAAMARVHTREDRRRVWMNFDALA